MKSNFNLSSILAIVLSLFIGVPYAGCLCIDGECCIPAIYDDGSRAIQESGHDGGDDCCDSEQCLINTEGATSHQSHNSTISVLRLLAYQSLVTIVRPRTIFELLSPGSSPPVYPFVFKTKAFLSATKTSSLLI